MKIYQKAWLLIGVSIVILLGIFVFQYSKQNTQQEIKQTSSLTQKCRDEQAPYENSENFLGGDSIFINDVFYSPKINECIYYSAVSNPTGSTVVTISNNTTKDNIDVLEIGSYFESTSLLQKKVDNIINKYR